LVRGFSEPEITSSGRITRSLCIDPDRGQVVWETWKNRYGARVYRYSSVHNNVEFASNVFMFEPPRGSTLTDFELPIPHPMGTRGLSTGPGVSLPRLAARKDPKYGEASKKARIEGTVILYVVVGIDGVPSDVLVYQMLSPDLDAEAVKAVRQWRFTPGARNGQSTALPVVIEVNFQLR
jgi:TonB family protein